MTIQNCFIASLLFCALTTVTVSQGTANRAPILTGFIPMPEQKLQEGYVRVFDNATTFGWRGNPRDSFINHGQLNFTGRVADTPFFFLGFDVVPWHIISGTDTAKPEGTMTPLFDGETLNGWTVRGNVQVEVENGAIKLTGGRLPIFVDQRETYSRTDCDC